jgi:predicted amidophosphoribosyltransferase
MFCSQCGTRFEDGARFCTNCGAPLQTSGPSEPIVEALPAPIALEAQPAPPARRQGRRRARPQDPYRDQIQQLRLQIKALKLDLQQINNNLANVRSQYYMTAAFVPRGLLRWGYKAMEDVRLMGPQQQKQVLQQRIMELERELLQLQQAQAAWRASVNRSLESDL